MAFNLPQKIPNDETTVFTVMTRLAFESNAINLGQGFPDFACPTQLAELVTHQQRLQPIRPDEWSKGIARAN
jgi:methionine transaminase